VAWLWGDGEAEPTRARFSYPTDEDISALADTYRPRPADVIDTTGAELIDLTDTLPERVR
jgi:hypothetical protein